MHRDDEEGGAMSSTPAERAHEVATSPRRYSYDQILEELQNMHKDTTEYRAPWGTPREVRIDVILRLLVLFETRKPQIVAAMRATLEDLGDQPRDWKRK
jgi:hypothetical protein